ncbi:MAG: cytochrome P450 [Microthrixaceae bacterium]
MPATLGHDVLTPDRVRDPYPYFAEMRELEPVHWNEHHRAWFVYRFDDVIAALKDTARFSSDRVWPAFKRLDQVQQRERASTYDILGNWMVFQDPPSHTRLRKLVAREFTPRAIERWRPRVEAVVNELIETVVSQREDLDLIRDFAYPLPSTVIAEMLSIPLSDRDLFKGWSDDMMVLVFGARGLADRHKRAQDGMLEMSEYMHRLVERLRKDPDESLISGLIAAQEEDEDLLTDDEIVANSMLFLFGGHETTTNLIGNSFRSLLEHPEALERVRADRTQLKPAIEELLRYDGPSKTEVRIATTDIELGGRTIREGDMVYLVQGSANRDPEVFANPDVLSFERGSTGHIGFGFGVHHCIGASLARLESTVALDALLTHVHDAESAGTEEWVPTMISRGMETFPISYRFEMGSR